MSFEDVRIPKDNLLGVEGKGLSQALAILDKGRIAVAAQAVDIAEVAYQYYLMFSIPFKEI